MRSVECPDCKAVIYFGSYRAFMCCNKCKEIFFIEYIKDK